MPCLGQLQSLEFLTERRNRTGMLNFTTPITSLGIIVPQFPFGAKTQSSPPEPESPESLEPRYGLALGPQAATPPGATAASKWSSPGLPGRWAHPSVTWRPDPAALWQALEAVSPALTCQVTSRCTCLSRPVGP